MIRTPAADLAPAIVVLAVAAAVLPFVSFPAWVTLTAAGLAMGMMIFIMASGLTLVFGLMDVLNFGHGALVSVGAYAAMLVLAPVAAWTGADSLVLNLSAIALAALAAMLVTGAAGLVFERTIVRPVYGQHLRQILVTLGGAIVIEQLLDVVFGPDAIPVAMPGALRGSLVAGEIAVEKYRLFAVALGLAVFAAMFLVLDRTRLGLLIRAGVENGPMVEALGYRIRRLFIGVFVAGSALAGLGGMLWGMYREMLTPSMGGEVLVTVFIVIIIGGLGSVGGCFIGALLTALVANYAGFLAPKLALASNIVVMVAVLLWRPAGLYPVARR
ncbi:MAG TPA: branched-chain amino acid ABC transporter permease [Usitatibacter sp.]|nr:branched-chain amino acid ABC transporter permease [Usitatibacter sp.]